MNVGATRLYIFDVDGTLRWVRTPGRRYPLEEHDWELMPNVAQTLRMIPWSGAGPWLAVASNQSGVGEGLLTAQQARGMIAATIVAALGYLPHHLTIEMCVCGDEGHCDRKKPNPGMLLSLLEKFSIGSDQALFVGDQPIDAEAAGRAGIPFVWASDFFRAAGTAQAMLDTCDSPRTGDASTGSISESQ